MFYHDGGRCLVLNLPVVVSFGGISPAGRSSGYHGYRRLVIESLSDRLAAPTWQSLAALCGRDAAVPSEREWLLRHSLVRRIESYDPAAVPVRSPLRSAAGNVFRLPIARLPTPLPADWHVTERDGTQCTVCVGAESECLLPTVQTATVQAAGQLPSGFDPATLYPSRGHPRGLQMTVYGASDAMAFLGVDWAELRRLVPPDAISVYAGSGMGQLDEEGSGGMLRASLRGLRNSARQCPFSFGEMPADFINAYLLGSLGQSGAVLGACSSFLYNLRYAMTDIQAGHARIAIVGCSEAPVVPEVIAGYAAMGALGTDTQLRDLDGLSPDQEPDYQRACRPFGDNCGFTIAESAQFVILFDSELALQTGAVAHAALAGVCVNADGYKQSIAAPGVGNYLSMARALALARAVVGEDSLRDGSFVLAHGTGTPQNRVTESQVLDRVAAMFGLCDWPVAAVKCYLGHSIGAAGGDQLMTALGVWRDGLIPGISTISEPAEDVSQKCLRISPEHIQVDPHKTPVALINAKGFGGNNASAVLLSPDCTEDLLVARHGQRAVSTWRRRRESVVERAADYDLAASRAGAAPIYRYGEGVLDGADLEFLEAELRVPGWSRSICLDPANPYLDTD